jgi:hypothetical protein
MEERWRTPKRWPSDATFKREVRMTNDKRNLSDE